MSTSKGLAAVVLMSLLAIIGLWAYGCNDKPTDPPPPPEPPKDYVVYTSCSGVPYKVFGYHPTTQVMDSTPVDWYPYYGLTVSADGKLLYGVEPNRIVVADSRTLEIVTELPYTSRHRPVVVSPDNQHIAILGDSLTILRTGDYSVYFSRSGGFGPGALSADGKSFYAPTNRDATSQGQVSRLDLTDSTAPIVHCPFDDGAVAQVIPSVDESKLILFLSVAAWTSAFEVYDVETDSIVYRQFLTPGYGKIAISPDGKYAFFNHTDLAGTGPPPEWPPSFSIFDLERNAVDRVVDVGTPYIADSGWFAAPNSMIATPDSRWLVILGGAMSQEVVYLYDLKGHQLICRQTWDDGSHSFTPLSVQSWM